MKLLPNTWGDVTSTNEEYERLAARRDLPLLECGQAGGGRKGPGSAWELGRAVAWALVLGMNTARRAVGGVMPRPAVFIHSVFPALQCLQDWDPYDLTLFKTDHLHHTAQVCQSGVATQAPSQAGMFVWHSWPQAHCLCAAGFAALPCSNAQRARAGRHSSGICTPLLQGQAELAACVAAGVAPLLANATAAAA